MNFNTIRNEKHLPERFERKKKLRIIDRKCIHKKKHSHTHCQSMSVCDLLIKYSNIFLSLETKKKERKIPGNAEQIDEQKKKEKKI